MTRPQKQKPPVSMPQLNLSYVQSVGKRLDELGLRDDPLGQAALRLAEQASIETGSALASLTRELRAVLGELQRVAAPRVADPVDELRKRRDAKRNAG